MLRFQLDGRPDPTNPTHNPAHKTAHGLAFAQEEVVDPRLLADIPEAAYMRFHLFTITKPPGATAAAATAAAAE